MLSKRYFCDNSLTVTYSVLVVSCREFSCSLISLKQYTTLELSWCASHLPMLSNEEKIDTTRLETWLNVVLS
jgi:hypothetical protein